MGRPRTTDREDILNAAERVVSAQGSAGLTFGNVATAAGLSKASVQSAFGTREALIDAMLDRWLRTEEVRFNQAIAADASPRGRMAAHIRTTADESQDALSRVATLLATLAGSGEQSRSAARWYGARIGQLSATTPAEKTLRMAFLAGEGAYFLRYLVGLEMSDALWQDIFSDLYRYVSDADGDEN